MRALIFAAGFGSRLRPITDNCPKALVSIGGKSLLQHNIEKLKAAGCSEIVVNIHHLGEQIVDFIANREWGLTIRISDERSQLLDTGGGLRQALPIFSTNDNPILLHNVDILSNANLAQLYAEADGSDVRLLVSQRKTQRYLLFDEEMRMVGWMNEATGEIRSPFKNLKPNQFTKLAFSGIHVVQPHLKESLNSYPASFPIMPFYIENCHQLRIFGTQQPQLQLLDVGKQDTLVQAEDFLRNTAF